MTIAEVREVCNRWLERVPRDILALIIVLLSSLASFGMGYAAGQDSGQGSPVMQLSSCPAFEFVVASRSGTKYYYPWCAGADQIDDAHRIWYPQAIDAENAGYTRASRCEPATTATMQ